MNPLTPFKTTSTADISADRGATLYLLASVALTVLLLLYIFRPIGDFDFWWHLKTGDIMLRQKSLLSIDPFNYTGDVRVHGREALILKGYWIWQVAAATLYHWFGTSGFFILKAGTAALLTGALLYEMHRQQLTRFTKVALSGLGMLAFMDVYNLERPQVFSIFFLTLLIGMLVRTGSGGKPNHLLYPMMTVWANIHGGFVVGDILLVLATAGFLLQYRSDGRRLLQLCCWTSAGVLASFLNPTGWIAFREIFNFMQGSFGITHVYEYRSTLHMFLDGAPLPALILWFFALVLITGLLITKRRSYAEIFIYLFIIAFGLRYIRNTGFIAISLLPVTGWYAEAICNRLLQQRRSIARIAVSALLLAAICWQIGVEWQQRQEMPGPIAPFFPAGMAEFLNDSGLSGNLFNEYNFGGYLDWALYPRWQTFVDSRELDTRVAGHYLSMLYADMTYDSGKPLHEQLLESYRIDVIALKTTLANGRLQPLLKQLLPNPQWIPVYLDNQSFVLARATQGNANAISRQRLDKELFLDRLTRQTANRANRSPNDIPVLVTYAEILGFTGKKAEADKIIRKLEASKAPDPDMLLYLKGR